MSIAIGSDLSGAGVSGLWNNSTTKTSDLESKLQSKPATDEELMEVCKSFESYLLEQVMKEMKKTVPNSEEQNQYLEYFGDMMYEEIAQGATEQKGLGIAQMLYESMKRNS
ncbi:MAG: hypothetical protein K0S47_953 [Herbinix sp.]|jgi:flagellar protein FlgJ|nr:hypothetical protein [Herbinix sp.]